MVCISTWRAVVRSDRPPKLSMGAVVARAINAAISAVKTFELVVPRDELAYRAVPPIF
jgi:hypothetical protein